MYLAFLSPVVIAFLIAYLYPVLRTVQMSFFEVSDISAARDTWEFVGLYNYVDLFSRQLFRVSFKNMMLIFLAGGAAVFLISLFFAWVLHKGMFMGNLWRNLIYLPTVITPVAMITVWTQYAYNSRYGLLKTVFETLGLDGLAAIPWTSTQYAFWSMLIAFCFCSIGGNLLVYMAAMKKIPDDLFEAAFMDGATEGKIFFRITLPLIADNVKTQFTFWTIGCIGFFLWSRVFSVVPSDPTTITPASYMYDQIFGTSISSNAVASGTNVGMGAAIGVVLCLITVAAMALINLIFEGKIRDVRRTAPMRKYPSFCLRQKSPPAGRVSGWAGKAVHVLGKALILCWCAFTVALIGWVVLASFTPTRDIFQNDLLAAGLDLSGYEVVMERYHIMDYFLNSVLYTVCACAGLIVFCAPAAFVMTKFVFRGRRLFQTLFSVALGLPGVMILAPLYMMLVRANLHNFRGTLILVYLCTGIAATTVYLMGFFATVPMTVFESGLIDGCSHITSFYRLILPLAKPGIVTITIFNFIGYWNEYIWALVFSGKQANRTLAVALQTLVTSMQTTGNYQGLFAGVVIVFVPTVIIYVLLSKQIMSGATAGAVKG